MKQQYYLERAVEIDFAKYFSRARKEIEFELSKLISSLSQADLRSKLEYAILSGGKRFRPFLVILSAENVGEKRSNVMPLALAFELMHTATLVHDDIIDQDETRRGQPSLYRKWSVSEAILTGDALIALSVDLASPYGETVLKTVAHSALELCDGERMDLVDSLSRVNEEVYFKKIRDKSASLCRAAAYCGAVAGGGTPDEANALSMFGENFGIAYQLRDDVLDFRDKGHLNLKDPIKGKITLPLIYCYANSSAEEKKKIKELQAAISKKPSEAKKRVNELLQLISNKDAFKYCENRIDEYLSHAIRNIEPLKNTMYKAYLMEMARKLRSWAGNFEQ